MYTLYKVMKISAAHSLDLDYKSKCNRLHGHNWKIEVWVKSNHLNENNMVIDFNDIKQEIMKYDHENLNDFFDNSTAEVLSYQIYDDLTDTYLHSIDRDLILSDVLSYSIRVRVWETETAYVEVGDF